VKLLKKNKEDQLQKVRNQNREKLDELTHRLVATSNQQESAEREIQSKEKEANMLRAKIYELESEIEKLKVSDDDLERLKRKVKEAERNLDLHASSNEDEKKLGMLQTEVQQMDTDRLRKREVLKRLNSMFERVVLMQQRSKDLDDLQRQVDGKVETERRNILSVLNLKSMPDLDTLAHKMTLCLDQLTKKEQETSANLHGMKGRLMAMEVQRNRIQAELEEVKTNLKAAQSNMAVYESKEIVKKARARHLSLKSAAEEVENEINEELKLNLAVENMGDMFQEYSKKAEAKSCCPLCDRPFKVLFLCLLSFDS
jgi:DNA repair exonuclease SbcCD ATPase subunit